MKTALVMFILSAGIGLAGPSDYVNFVRQIQGDSGVEWDVSVSPTGQMLSPEGVGSGGSTFQLWSVKIENAKEYLLDEEFVSPGAPEAGITIQTGDPYPLVPRTRVDQPFTVTASMFSALIDATSQVVNDMAYLSHEGFLYPEGEHTLANIKDPEPQFSNGAFIEEDGTQTIQFQTTSLTGPDMTKVEGEEVFSILAIRNNAGHGNNEDGVDVSNPDYDPALDESGGIDDEVTGNNGEIHVAEVIDTARIQIWPIADATISGLDPTEIYSQVPPVTVDMNDLYPSSQTSIRVYMGPPVAEPAEFTDIPEGYVVIVDSIPQDRSVLLKELDEVFEEEGNYTLEVVHNTPFGVDLLSQFYPIQVDRTIEIRGTLYSTD